MILVELAGIEPVSENPLTQPSSQTVALLNFPCEPADRQADSPVALLCMVDTKANSQLMFTTDLTLGRGRRPPLRNGRYSRPRHCRHQRLTASILRQPEQLCCCRLFLKVDILTGLSGPLRLSCLEIPVETNQPPEDRRRTAAFSICFYIIADFIRNVNTEMKKFLKK